MEQEISLAGELPVVKRRRYSDAQKRRMVEETLVDGDSVSVVAKRYDVNTNLLFKWRKQYLASQSTGSALLVPVSVRTESEELQRDSSAGQTGRLEVAVAKGHRVVVTGGVEPALLRTALKVLSM